MSWKAGSRASGSGNRIRPGFNAIPWVAGFFAFVALFPVFGGRALALTDREYNLYFAGNDKTGLAVEKRAIRSRDSLTDRIRAVVKSLTAGPNGSLDPALAPGLEVRRVFVTRGGTAYVDLTPPPDRPKTVGVNRERLCLWSIINTICLNFQEIREVKILVNGDETDTLFGHIDLSRPLLPDRRLIQNPR